LPCRRCRNNVSTTRRCHSRAHSCGVGVALGSQCRVSQIYVLAYLEPFLGSLVSRSVERMLVRRVGKTMPDAFRRMKRNGKFAVAVVSPVLSSAAGMRMIGRS